MEQRTHPRINADLVGQALSIEEGRATAELVGTSQMAADERGLIHGGFTFGLADFTAMLAVNDPNVVLGGSSSKFLAPVTVGQRMVAVATVQGSKGRRRTVSVVVTVEDKTVFKSEMACFVLDNHVLGE